MRELAVWIDRTRVATLREANDLWALEYAAEWIASPEAYDLSPALPRSAGTVVDGASRRPVQWYFDNLLPEGELRDLIARDEGLPDANDAFALLARLGQESAGSLTLSPPEVPPPAEAALPPLQPLPDAVLSARIGQLPRTALTRTAPKRMSLAGAQHKLLVVLKGQALYEPVGATASTHILKPEHPDAQTYPASTWLEAVTMDLAGAAGLPVPAVTRLHVPEPVYVIQRFDRIVAPAALRPDSGTQPPPTRRRHVIDACQLLNQARTFKHRGATLHALREAIERSGDRLTLPLRIFRWLVFNLLVGNDDCHLKNLSFLVEAGSLITLAPHYDLLATAVYHTRAIADDQARWPDVPLAIPLAPDVRRFTDVTPDAVLQAARVLGVPDAAARRAIREVVTRSLQRFEQVYAQHCPEDAAPGPPPLRAPPGDDDPGGLSAIERRLLHVLRHIVLAEMQPRLLPSGAAGAR